MIGWGAIFPAKCIEISKVGMAYDLELAERIHSYLKAQQGITERKMFGGLSFLLYGNMVCGVLGDDLIVRVGPEMTGQALSEPFTREFDFTGRPMRGWVVVEPDALVEQEKLAGWVKRGVSFASSLPRKE